MSTIIIITPPPKKQPARSAQSVTVPDELSIPEQLREAADILEGKQP